MHMTIMIILEIMGPRMAIKEFLVILHHVWRALIWVTSQSDLIEANGSSSYMVPFDN